MNDTVTATVAYITQYSALIDDVEQQIKAIADTCYEHDAGPKAMLMQLYTHMQEQRAEIHNQYCATLRQLRQQPAPAKAYRHNWEDKE
jgi:phage host-nuclease inhibitor protein Gam